MASIAVSYFSNLFREESIYLDNNFMEQVSPQIMDNNMNLLLTMVPSKDDICNVVFGLNKNNAPGPDGFGGVFFHTYWHLIEFVVCNAILEFFTKDWILPNYNVNTIILIPKTKDSYLVDMYIPIALENFKFKIISKIIADRLASILPNIISKEQKGFTHGINIMDCTCLTFESINNLDNKNKHENLALKVDIDKAFDTINWEFLLKVLKTFGFSQIFCKWSSIILN